MTDEFVKSLRAAANANDRPVLFIACALPTGRYAHVEVQMSGLDLKASAKTLADRYGVPAFASLLDRLAPEPEPSA